MLTPPPSYLNFCLNFNGNLEKRKSPNHRLETAVSNGKPVSAMLGMQATSEGQPFFIRLAASDVLLLSTNTGRRSSSRVVALFISIPLGVAVLSSLLIGAWFLQRRRERLFQKVEYDTPTSLTMFTYKELKIASNNFSYKLGKGAFGSVFKATLPDNTLVAVKKLEGSAQAEKQFRAEISTIGNIHHVNLVRLRGFCVEGSQRMLVYEYMQNGSLNSFLSGKSMEEDKVDVYSFGMTLLEIISGRRNIDLRVQESQYYFPTWAATEIHKGNTIGIVDERIANNVDVEEVGRAAMVSILCIQKDESGRPSMAQVVRILEGKSECEVEPYEKSLQALVDDH
ncbi:hypothetical protein SUGI_0664110 [Cryptomeria japonica]|nr:hypothetical protein SUGI_0664110 [Cryptomeria japonica]